MIRSTYSNTAYGRMRDRISEKEKREDKKEETVKKHVPYRTLLAF